MVKHIYIVDLESVPSRYTCEWKWHLPQLLKSKAREFNSNVEIINISGGEQSIEATPGAFLNFQQTNIYKNNQINDIANRFSSEVQPGDKFVFADAWHTGILQLKYMSELLGIPVEIYGLWHAGSYDPYDFLGRIIGDTPWVRHTEKALFSAIDVNCFATNFHIDLFKTNLLGLNTEKSIWWDTNTWDALESKFLLTGWPMEYMPGYLGPYKNKKKEDIIIFPHRVAPEKQPEIFRDLAESLPQYKFVVCQDEKLTKQEYHELLSKSKIMWSANLQETLGISPYEGACLDVIPLLPDRLSYSEMYDNMYLYNSSWTTSYDNYLKNKEKVIKCIVDVMNGYDYLSKDLEGLSDELSKEYFSATNLINKLLDRK